MVAGRGKNRKDSRRKAEPDPTSIQPPGLAEAPRAQSPEETTEPKEAGPVESAPPVEHRRRGVIRVRPSQRPKPNIKAVTAPHLGSLSLFRKSLKPEQRNFRIPKQG